MVKCLFIIPLFLFCVLHKSDGFECQHTSEAYNRIESFSCPQEDDEFDKVFCCEKSRCCSFDDFSFEDALRQNQQSFWSESLPEPQASTAKSVFKFLGIIFGLLVFVAIVATLCCCCPPCCLLNKRKRRGQTHGPVVQEGQAMTQSTNLEYPQQQQYPPTTIQPSPYPLQQQQLYPQPGYGPPAGYPAQPPPYSAGPADVVVPESYPLKQPAFNPNAAP